MVAKAALMVGSIVYVEKVQPPQGGNAKDRRVIILRAPTADDDTFTFVVIATLRNSDPADDEVRIPHKATFKVPVTSVLQSPASSPASSTTGTGGVRRWCISKLAQIV